MAGLDVEAGGTWLGLNDDGLMAAILNRKGSLGPAPGKRSRGELVLEVLDHAEAPEAAAALADIDPAAYRPFNLVVADPQDAFLVAHRGDGSVTMTRIEPGLHMIEASELDDPRSARIRSFRQRFADSPPDPDKGDWADWQGILADRTTSTGDPRDAMCIITDGAYGTVSSSLIALPRYATERPIWLFADGRPGEAPFAEVEA